MGSSIARIAPTNVLLNGTVPVSLWISWANGSLSAGKGNETGKNTIIYYPDNSLIVNISTMGISSFGAITGLWKIAYNQSSGEQSIVIYFGFCVNQALSKREL